VRRRRNTRQNGAQAPPLQIVQEATLAFWDAWLKEDISAKQRIVKQPFDDPAKPIY
jgi:hypothetical protein